MIKIKNTFENRIVIIIIFLRILYFKQHLCIFLQNNSIILRILNKIIIIIMIMTISEHSMKSFDLENRIHRRCMEVVRERSGKKRRFVNNNNNNNNLKYPSQVYR